MIDQDGKAADSLSKILGASIRLDSVKSWSNADGQIEKFTVNNGESDQLAEVIAIQSSNPLASSRLIGGYCFLESFGFESSLLGVDHEQNVVFSRTSGKGVSEVLKGSDPEVAKAALVERAVQKAKLHAITMGKWSEYRAARLAVSPDWPSAGLFNSPSPDYNGNPIDEEDAYQRALDYLDVVNGLGVFPHNSVVDELTHLAVRTEGNPGANWCFCVGGMDFDIPLEADLLLSGFRPRWSAGLDESFSIGCLNTIPEAVASAMGDAYRSEIGKTNPATANDSAARADAAARWHAITMLHRIPVAIKSDAIVGPSTHRQQVIASLRSFERIPQISTSFPALSACCSQILDSLRQEWSAGSFTLPTWPTFAVD